MELDKDAVNEIITDLVRFRSEAGKIEVYGFVVMSNHIHNNPLLNVCNYLLIL
ncbi:hypothetical protein BH10BAC2_BH10BAC2_15500 [soil metagenome]